MLLYYIFQLRIIQVLVFELNFISKFDDDR